MRILASLLLGALALSACGSESDICADYISVERDVQLECESPDLSNPSQLAACAKGAGVVGAWAVDEAGLPAFDFQVDHRCDPATLVLGSDGDEAGFDPVHIIGNGKGMMALAHASGGIEVYSQERGHRFVNHLDTWRDSDNKKFPRQIAGGFNYLVVDGKVRSTRFDDHKASNGTSTQTRRFGVGYFETVTTFDDLRVTRRVFAPSVDGQALVAEVKLENLSDSYLGVGLVEFWDINDYQLRDEGAVSDKSEDRSDDVRRARREINSNTEQTLHYSRQTQIAVVQQLASQVPSDIVDANSESETDYFAPSVFLALIDNGEVPDAVWLSDDELWSSSSTKRGPPSKAAKKGDGETRELVVSGVEQSALVAMRVSLSVPIGSPVTRRFAFGYTPSGVEPSSLVTELRAKNGELLDEASTWWKEHLAWFAVDAEDGGLIQRELAWSSYYAQANALFDELRGYRVLGAGGAKQFVAGLGASASEIAVLSESLIHIAPELVRETLLHALSAQHGSTSETPWRFPQATSGVGHYSDMGNLAEPSSAYAMLPGAVARYVEQTRDRDFLSAKASYWPTSSEELGSVVDHLSRGLQYAQEELGMGANGLFSFGSNDYSDGFAPGELAAGASSVFNAAAASMGFPAFIALVAEEQPELGAGFADLVNSQSEGLEGLAWNGAFYERAFGEDGLPVEADSMYLSSQVLAILAGLADEARVDTIYAGIDARLGQSAGATAANEEGLVVPSVSSWLVEAKARRDPVAAWSEFLLTTLGTRADTTFSGYAPWTGPGSSFGLGAATPGAPMDGGFLAGSDFPALGMDAHVGPLRSAVAMLGITADASNWRISPRLPSENYSVELPRLRLAGTASSVEGAFRASGDDLVRVEVTLPSAAREAGLAVKVRDLAVPFDRGTDGTVLFDMSMRKGEWVSFSVKGL